ncbi:murein transglycosylase A [Sphingomonas jaspsi]|uniref:murein transglycosylase A n=1 Tax=Sphingomonas jaspsi TaxID=392409 RepID=UPI0004AE6C60|nr:MltA domain-containing protein [Sphingomonas jaspsi]
MAVTPPVAAPAEPAPTPTFATAAEAGVTLVQAPAFDVATAAPALSAFRSSCASLQSKVDRSGLTQPSDWRAVCAEATSVADADAARFFADRFDWVQVGDGAAFSTGYYESEIPGVRTRQTGFDVPVYGKPASLVRCTRPDGTSGRGRVDADGACLPYFTRAEIEDGALSAETPIAWVADPIDLFFLQVQGSGRLHGPNGEVMRIGYAEQNGQPYVAIGRLLRDRALLPKGGATMDGIIAWMRAQPDGGKSLMRENPSYVFFRELGGSGPLGALNVPVVPQVSVAIDPAFVPLGAPVFLQLDAFAGQRLWVAQDTGGAIKGANRFDTYWGAGDAAKAFAGKLSSKGKALLLLPKGSAARLAASGASTQR